MKPLRCAAGAGRKGVLALAARAARADSFLRYDYSISSLFSCHGKV